MFKLGNSGIRGIKQERTDTFEEAKDLQTAEGDRAEEKNVTRRDGL